MSLIVQTQ